MLKSVVFHTEGFNSRLVIDNNVNSSLNSDFPPARSGTAYGEGKEVNGEYLAPEMQARKRKTQHGLTISLGEDIENEN